MRRFYLLVASSMALAGCVATIGAQAETPAENLPPAATAHPSLWPVAHSPAAITDARTEARITALLSRMTLEQKVGQLIQADISTITPEDLAKYPLGSILAGGNSGPFGNERSSGADWHRLVDEFRAASMKPGANGIAIPIIFGVDAVHGHNNVPGATIFPHNIALGAAHDADLVHRIGEATAAEVAGTGIDWTFAPTLAVPQDLRWGRSYEGYAADPKLVAKYARAMVSGLQGRLVSGQAVAADHVAATAKHYIADGGTDGGKDEGDARISERTLIATHAQGYPAAIDAGVLTVMASFSSWNGVKNHGNRSLLTDVLKQRMGFKGFVVGDWNGQGQVEGCTVTDCPRALMAGLDMFMAPDSWKGLFENTVREARDGTIPMSRIDDAVRRILRVKFKLGLMDNPPEVRRDLSQIGSPAHLALAREAVAKSLVLLKNNGSVLPIRPGARVLVAGAGANDMAMQSGGWTISWQGTDVTHADFPKGKTVWEGIDQAVREAGGTATLSVDGHYTQTPDVVIVVYGEHPYAEYQGDVPTLAFQPGGKTDLSLLKKLKAAGIPVVSVFLSGRPLFTSAEINASDAFVAAWLPGSQADGIADVLVDRRSGSPLRDFTGRLPFPWPADARSPVKTPLFPAGYGLDYEHPKAIGHLSEDPRMNVVAALNVDHFFEAGHARSPWSMSVVDPGGKRPVSGVPVTSPGGAVEVRSVDVHAQEDAKRMTWRGAGSVTIEGPPADLSRQLSEGFALNLQWRIDSRAEGPVTIAFGNVPVSITGWLAAQPTGKLVNLRIPLRCFADKGANLSHVDSALQFGAGSGFAATLISADLEPVGTRLDCPPATLP